MATSKRVEVVTIEGLTASIEKAIAIAAKRHGVEFDSGTVAVNWEIFGRRLLAVRDGSSSALDVASTVVTALKLKGPRPVAIDLGKWVLAGYWDPQSRDRAIGSKQ
jgi:hypothetical protein